MSSRARAETQAPAAGDLLDLAALDRDGVFVRCDGTLVRIFEVIPINPEVLAEDRREIMIDGLGKVLAHLDAGASLQIYAEASPVQVPDLLAGIHARLEAAISTQTAERAVAMRELAGAYQQTLKTQAIDNTAVRLRVYLIAPHQITSLASAGVDWAAMRPGAHKPKTQAGIARSLDEHRRARRESEVHTDNLRAELEALGLATVGLNGLEVAELIYRRLNPSTADHAMVPRLEISGELDAHTDAQEAADAAQRLRQELAAAPLDFSDSRHVGIEDDLERIVYVSSLAETTPLGWTLEVMQLDRPFVLSMHVHATNRASERTSTRRRARRLRGLNYGAVLSGKVPNPDRLAQEAESWTLLEDMRTHRATTLYDVSLYQAIREPGPAPDPVRLAETAQRAAKAIQDASEATAKVGTFLQRTLFVSTLPIGLDAGRNEAKLTKRYATRHAAASLPIFGASCGSPLEEGALPMFSARGVSTLEGLNPWDRLFINRLMIVNGLQGSGKTMFGISTAARLLPLGTQITVLDRSDHWKLLADLIPGAAHLELGPGRDKATINPWDVEDPNRLDPQKVSDLIALHQVLLGAHDASTDTHALTPIESGQLDVAIRRTYRNCAQEGRGPLERDLQATLRQLQGEEEEKTGGARSAISDTFDTLSARLEQYVGDGRDAYLVDRPTTVPQDAPLVVFDTRNTGDQLTAAMFIALQHTITKIQRRNHLRDTGELISDRHFRGDALFADESWSYLRNRASAEAVHSVVRRSRHLRLFALFITQHLDDYDNEFGRPLLRSASMKLFFQQSAEELRYLKDTLGLAENEVELISRLGTSPGRFSRAYWMNGPRGRGEVQLRLGDLEYWLATSNPNDLPRRAAAFAKHPTNPWAALHQLNGAPRG